MNAQKFCLGVSRLATFRLKPLDLIKSPEQNPRPSLAILPNNPQTNTSPVQKTQSYTVMKTYIPYSLLLAAASAGMAFGAETAYTTPVGYVSLGNTTPSQSAVAANTEVRISIPLDREVVFQGVVDTAGVTGSTIPFAGTPALGNLTTVPHIAIIANGAKSGLVGLVTANTANSVTIQTQSGEVVTDVAAGAGVVIQKAWTVSSLLSGGVIPTGTQLFAFSGTAPGIVIAPDLIFEFDGTDWVDTNSFEPANNVVLYPGEGFVLRNPTTTPIPSLVVSGTVPKANHRLIVSNLSAGVGQDIPFGFTSPVNEVVGLSGAGFTIGDQILAFNNTTTGVVKAPNIILEWDGADWVDTDSFEPVTTTFSFQGGVSYVYRRPAGAPAGDVTWSNQPTYVPSL